MIPLFSTDQVRQVDTYAINELGMPGIVLMENAALQIYNIVIGKTTHLKRNRFCGFICGKGNNGGDGFAVARQFANHGYKVNVIYSGGESEMSDDCKINFNILSNLAQTNTNIKIKKYESVKDLRHIVESGIIFDAMLGTGAKGSLREPYKTIVENFNKTNAFKVAIDIPTGFDADKGFTDLSFVADLTVTLGEFKAGLFFGDGAFACGEVIKGNIGVSNSFFDRFKPYEYLIEPEDVISNLPSKKKTANKYTAGKVLTIAGSGAFPGAAAMTSKSTLKVGAGASILCFPKSVRKLIHKNISEVVVNAFEDNESEILREENVVELSERLKWADVTAIGPGLGRAESTQIAVRKIIEEHKFKNIVIDADAIFALSGNRYKDFNLENSVFTPHHGEFANLLDIEGSKLKEDILGFGRQFVNETGAYLVLKGAPTIIFTPGSDALINTTGNPGMAKFGTGDVLTGVLAGFISQKKDLETAIIIGVYIHSLAADLLVKDFTEFGYTALDIISNLPKAIKFLRKSFV